MSTKHQAQHQEQASQHQEQGSQKQEQKLPPDPVAEQQKSYKVPENAIANDPITEVTTVAQAMAEAAKEQPKQEPKKE